MERSATPKIKLGDCFEGGRGTRTWLKYGKKKKVTRWVRCSSRWGRSRRKSREASALENGKVLSLPLSQVGGALAGYHRRLKIPWSGCVDSHVTKGLGRVSRAEGGTTQEPSAGLSGGGKGSGS